MMDDSKPRLPSCAYRARAYGFKVYGLRFRVQACKHFVTLVTGSLRFGRARACELFVRLGVYVALGYRVQGHREQRPT